MNKGIIYKYTSPSGKVYIGQTTDESSRRRAFRTLGRSYGGNKIDNARRKYLPENFTYEVLYTKNYVSVEEAKEDLDKMEMYYIGYYDSYNSGYNSTLGGGGCLGLSPTEETRQKLKEACTGWHQTEEIKHQISRSKMNHTITDNVKKIFQDHNDTTKKAIVVYEYKTDKYIGTFDSILVASQVLNVDRRNIYSVLKGRTKSTKGYCFKLKENV